MQIQCALLIANILKDGMCASHAARCLPFRRLLDRTGLIRVSIINPAFPFLTPPKNLLASSGINIHAVVNATKRLWRAIRVG